VAPRATDLGTVRRSQVICVSGPGAIVDFRARDGAPISAVVCGLEEWEARARTQGLENPNAIFEPRLQARLRVDGFRLPPVSSDDHMRRRQPSDVLLAVRFPRWLQCPKCHILRQEHNWQRGTNSAARYCSACSEGEEHRVHVVPSRFILACTNGHLDEFPWNWWIQHAKDCKREKDIKLEGRDKAGFANLILSCLECGANKPMDGCFGRDAIRGVGCHGRRPWIAGPNETCTRVPRTVLRGGSNLYFAVNASALDIPPWSEHIQQRLGTYWRHFRDQSNDADRLKLIELLKLESTLGMPAQNILKLVKDRIAILQSPNETVRWEEYLQLTNERPQAVTEDSEFRTKHEVVPADLRPWFSRLVRVTRLREVRALVGFTRIKPPSESAGPDSATLCEVKPAGLNWLPAIEVRGEGIFIQFNESSLARWEQSELIRTRTNQINQAFIERGRSLQPDGYALSAVTPRHVLLHSFAHVLMRQLSLDCGYSHAALRERLYIDTGERPMAGILIYTATPDSEGTLGGLSRQGRPARFAEAVHRSVRSAVWCSSDPLCIEAVQSFSEPLNQAACHSCLLVPETACELFNLLLDRATLVGTPQDRGVGFFSNLLT